MTILQGFYTYNLSYILSKKYKLIYKCNISHVQSKIILVCIVKNIVQLFLKSILFQYKRVSLIANICSSISQGNFQITWYENYVNLLEIFG